MNLQVEKNRYFLVNDSGKKLEVTPSFERDNAVLSFLDGSNIKRLIKKQSKQTFISNKDKKEKHFYNFYVIFDNNKSVQIKTFKVEDLAVLDAICDYVK